MMTPTRNESLDDWRETLETSSAPHADLFERVHVVEETDSTQDLARRMGAGPGTIITALRQTSGRGRYGRTWIDAGSMGTATSFVLPVSDASDAPLLTLAAAVAVANAVDIFLPSELAAGIKWPNDIIVARRKVAGILTEVSGEVAIVGIGINVRQQAGDWTGRLESKAIGLRQVAVIDPQRVAVVSTLITQFGRALRKSERDLIAEFRRRDVLRDAMARVGFGSEVIEGVVVEVEPMRHLLIRTKAGVLRRIAADRASIESARGALVDLVD